MCVLPNFNNMNMFFLEKIMSSMHERSQTSKDKSYQSFRWLRRQLWCRSCREADPGQELGLSRRLLFGEQPSGFALHRPFRWCLGVSDGSGLSPGGSGDSSGHYRVGWEGCGISLSFLEFLLLQEQLKLYSK